MRSLLYWTIFRSQSFIIALLVYLPALAETGPQNSAIDLICIADRPTIILGETTKLEAVAMAQDGNTTTRAVSFQWQVSDGVVQGAGSHVEWILSRVPIESGQFYRKVTATVKAMIAGRAVSSCSVSVFVGSYQEADSSSNVRGGRISSSRGYLLPHETESPGYGLYTYLLLSGRPQSEEELVRYLKTLEAGLKLMREHNDLGRYVRPSQLNSTHIPVTQLPIGNETDPNFARKVLSVYDFARAKVLLNKFEKMYDRGPYLVSVKTPLTSASEVDPAYMFMDFSNITPELAATSVKHFESLAAQERTWTEQSVRDLRLKIRNLFAVAGRVVPEVASAILGMSQ